MFNPAKKSFLKGLLEVLQENPPPQGAKDATPIGAPDHRYTGDICYECRDPWCAGCEYADTERT
jgi:hypothetical protein